MKCELDVEETFAESEPERKSQSLIPALSVVSIYIITINHVDRRPFKPLQCVQEKH